MQQPCGQGQGGGRCTKASKRAQALGKLVAGRTCASLMPITPPCHHATHPAPCLPPDLEEVHADGHELGLALVLQRAGGAQRAGAMQPAGAHRALGAVMPAGQGAAWQVFQASLNNLEKGCMDTHSAHSSAQLPAHKINITQFALLTCRGSPCRAARTCRCGSRGGSTQ